MPGGQDTQLGMAEETVFGTAVTPTRFAEYVSESLKFDRERIEGQGLRVGRRTQDRWVAGRKGVSGDVTFEAMPNGFGLIAKHLLGTVATTTPGGGTTARLHTAKVGQLDGKSLTIQIGKPNSAGTVDPFTYSGCKIGSWELSMETGSPLMCTIGVDGMDEDTATVLASPVWPTYNELLSPYDSNASITIGGTTYDVKKATISGNNGLATDRNAIGSATKREQLEGGQLREYTGTIDLTDYKGLTPYNLFKQGTESAIVYTFKGSLIELALNYMVKVTLPRCRFDGDSPNVSGPQLLDHAMPFKALYSNAASTEAQIEVQNTDPAA